MEAGRKNHLGRVRAMLADLKPPQPGSGGGVKAGASAPLARVRIGSLAVRAEVSGFEAPWGQFVAHCESIEDVEGAYAPFD